MNNKELHYLSGTFSNWQTRFTCKGNKTDH